MARVLSIQSHVVYGYVGGKAAVFPLQLLGYDVDVVNTVNYSNHAGYGRAGGTKTSPEELNGIFNAMSQNELLRPTRLLTGYIPGGTSLSAVADLARKLKSQNPHLIYILDPVMGDAGRLYVAPDVIPIYQAMISLATIITPNWFEVETLTGIPLTDFTSLRRAIEILHKDCRVANVVISSIPLHSWLKPFLPSIIKPAESTTSPYLLCIASEMTEDANSDNISKVSAGSVPQIPGYFSGVGDLFSALILGHYHPQMKQNGKNVPNGNAKFGADPLTAATTLALSITHAVLSSTHSRALALPEAERLATDDELDAAEPLRQTRRMRGRELALVQSRRLITSEEAIPRYELVPWEKFWA
ncbi:hypothetical protein APHAL10511_003985 [Amanita phalloides]|nr:hypothetical protein APHAL10511_003985 [Amanita phalloides]